MHNAERYRRRSRFASRGGYGRVARWVPLVAAGLLLAFLWFFPLADETTNREGFAAGSRMAVWEEAAVGASGSDWGTSDGSARTVAVSEGPIVINSFEEVSQAVSRDGASADVGVEGAVEAMDVREGAERARSGEGAAGASASTGERAVLVTDGSPEAFDYSRWGYASYAAYRAEHPFWARVSYARLWTGWMLKAVQPAGCSQCSRKSEESMDESPSLGGAGLDVRVVEKPVSGFVFESAGKGRNPQLTVKAPETADAFVKLKDVETGETYLSFYVGAGTTVAACVPAEECLVYYALGEEWFGPDEAFGDQGLYAKSDERLRFADPSNTYTYTLNVEGGNISPIMIDRAEFC